MKTINGIATAQTASIRVGGGVKLAAACLLAIPSLVSAQPVDSGRLELRSGGSRVAVESFRVWEVGADLNAAASIAPTGNRGGEFQVVVSLDGQRRPVRYGLRGPDSRSIEGTWSIDRVRLHTITEEGERWREIASRGPSSVLEAGVAHHHLLLVHVLREEGGPVTLIVPLRTESIEARLVGQEDTEVSVDDRPIAATRYDIRVGSSTRQVWIDAEGRLLRVLDAEAGLEAVRLPPR